MTLEEMQAQLSPAGPDFVELILLIAAVAMLLRICWTDFSYLKIYNRDLLVLLALAAAYLMWVRPEDALWRLGLGAILFTVAFIFWLFGKAGAGDAKLFGVVGAFVPPDSAMQFAFLLLVFTIAYYVLRSRALPLKYLPVMAGRRLLELIETRRIPYGIPIALATIVLVARQIMRIL